MANRASTQGISANDLVKDQFKGERVFAVGTGPSANEVDWPSLKDEYLWGCGLSFQMEGPDHLDFYTVTEQVRFPLVEPAIRHLDIPKFYNRHWQATEMNELYNYPDPIAPPEWKTTEARHVGIETISEFGFSPDLEWVCTIPEASFISAVLQPALWLGFDEIYLIGCDFSTIYAGGSKRVEHQPKWIHTNLMNLTKYMREYRPEITMKNLSQPWDNPDFKLDMEYLTLEEALG